MCALACEDCEATFPVALILRRAVRIAVEREYHKPQKAARLYSRGKPLGFAPVRESSRNASACAHTQGIGKCKVCTGVFAWHDHRAPRDHGPRSNCPGPTSYRPDPTTLPSFASLPSSSSPPLCLSLSQMHSSNLSLCVRGSFFPFSFVSAFLLRFSLPLPPSLSAPERTPENFPERTWRGRCLPLPPSLSPLMLLSARGEGADGSKTGRTNSSLGAQDRRTAVSSRSPDSARAVRVWIPASQHAGHSHPASRA